MDRQIQLYQGLVSALRIIDSNLFYHGACVCIPLKRTDLFSRTKECCTLVSLLLFLVAQIQLFSSWEEHVVGRILKLGRHMHSQAINCRE